MRKVFADAAYWIALISKGDQWRPRAIAASEVLAGALVVTTEMVLTEVLNAFTRSPLYVRQVAVRQIDRIRDDQNIHLVPQTRDWFNAALDLFRSRLDQEWSFTDCTSKVSERSGEWLRGPLVGRCRVGVRLRTHTPPWQGGRTHEHAKCARGG